MRAARGMCLAITAALLSGCTSGIVRKGVQRRIERKLHVVLGPADQYRVRILGTRDADLALGRAKQVEVEGKRIFVHRQLLLDSLRLSLFDLRYEGGDPDFISIRRSDLEVEVTEKALNDYLKAYQARYEPDLKLEADRVTAAMTYKFLGKPTRIQATGKFVIQEGRRLLFDADQADVSFLNTPGFGEKFVEDRLNPVLDLAGLEFPARLETVQILPGRLRARGTAAIRQEVKD